MELAGRIPVITFHFLLDSSVPGLLTKASNAIPGLPAVLLGVSNALMV